MKDTKAEQRAVGSLIKKRREQRGLSQTELGEIVGMTQRYLSKIERGGVKVPRETTLEKFFEPLGLTLVDFYAARGLLPATPTQLVQAVQADVAGIRDKVDAEIMADLVSALNPLAWHETLDTLREMKEHEPLAFYWQAVRALASAMAANLRYHGDMLRIPRPGREADNGVPS